MVKESENIFEEAGKQANKRKKPNKKKKRPLKSRSLSGVEKNQLIDPELEEMFNRIQNMQDDLKTKIEYIQTQAEPFFRDFSKVLADPELIQGPEVEAIQKKQEQLENEVASIVGTDVKARGEKKRAQRARKQSKKAHKLKAKKKDWLSMD